MSVAVVIERVTTLDPAWFASCDFGFGTMRAGYPFDAAFAVPRAGRMIAILRIDGQAAGYVACQREAGAAEVRRIEIDRAQRGRGLGRLLLEEARGWAVESGLPALRLETLADNPAAGRFFARYGFVPKHAGDALLWHLPLGG